MSPRIILIEEGQAPLMLLPLGMMTQYGCRIVNWMGAPVTDYQAPLIRRGAEVQLTPDAFGSLWTQITKTFSDGDLIRLEGQPSQVGSQPNPFFSRRTGVAL